MNEHLHLSEEALIRGFPATRQSPPDNGVLESIVVRPAENERRVLERCRISEAQGVHGDIWSRECWRTLDDGRPHPEVQVCIMNSRVIDLVAGSRGRWALAGDNLFVDLDLSRDNLPTGQRLRIGDSVIEITDQAHNACGKFAQRYGKDAARFVNTPQGNELRLRGVYAKVVVAGEIAVGDRIVKVGADPAIDHD